MPVYLDIETTTWFSDPHITALPRAEQLAAMRFGCAVTHRTDLNSWQDWQPGHIVNLVDLLGWCDLPIVGWNIVDFDLPVIHTNALRAGWQASPVDAARIVDLFAMIRAATNRWYSLETVAQTNLNRGKLADGQKAAEWLRSGDPEQIAKALEYCRYDVQLTIDLHAILLRGDPLRLPPRTKRQELNEILWWLDGRVERVPDVMEAISTR